MARIKLAYIGGGSTRAPGTMASFIEQGQNFQGSEVVLIDLDAERLALVKRIAEKGERRRENSAFQEISRLNGHSSHLRGEYAGQALGGFASGPEPC